MIKLADSSICTGCGACKKVCPKQAIDFRDDDEGFPTPYIQADKCVECGICNKVCPALHMPETHSIQTAYAAQLLDREALKDSTSGGLFTAFAREIFRRDGVVYGCVWDREYNAVIRKAENEDEMKPMRGSKYVWSWAGDTFPEIKEYLEADRMVLFTGLPCQVAGLKNYLRKDYENLYLLDFLCSGTPSPIAFKEWLNTFCESKDYPELNLKFRDKNLYGVGVHITYNGQKKKKHNTGEHIRNPYYYSFYIKLIDRKSCFHCSYGTAERVSDITICDYWGIGKYHQEFNISKGVSGLMVNSNKGRDLVESVRGGNILVETEIEYISEANNLSLQEIKEIKPPSYRDEFFKTLKTKGWTAAERKYLYNKTRLKLWMKMKIPAKYVPMIKKLMGRK